MKPLEFSKKCHNCDGKGYVEAFNAKKEPVRKSECYYCNGKGWRNKSYGQDD